MTFDEWWGLENTPNHAKTVRRAWDAATTAERARYQKLVESYELDDEIRAFLANAKDAAGDTLASKASTVKEEER